MDGYEARYSSRWINPSPEDIERGKNKEPVDHHKYWNLALDDVVNQVPEGDVSEWEVHRRIQVKHRSPGWVDGYRVDLS
jgi:hypothetical protein